VSESGRTDERAKGKGVEVSVRQKGKACVGSFAQANVTVQHSQAKEAEKQKK